MFVKNGNHVGVDNGSYVKFLEGLIKYKYELRVDLWKWGTVKSCLFYVKWLNHKLC